MVRLGFYNKTQPCYVLCTELDQNGLIFLWILYRFSLAIITLVSSKPKSPWHSLIVAALVALNNFIRKRFTTNWLTWLQHRWSCRKCFNVFDQFWCNLDLETSHVTQKLNHTECCEIQVSSSVQKQICLQLQGGLPPPLTPWLGALPQTRARHSVHLPPILQFDHWPSRYVTSHLGLLSLAIPLWVDSVSTSESWDVNRHTARFAIAPWSGSVNWCLDEG